jgi:hypothetical protein
VTNNHDRHGTSGSLLSKARGHDKDLSREDRDPVRKDGGQNGLVKKKVWRPIER